jgi:thioredoxin 1
MAMKKIVLVLILFLLTGINSWAEGLPKLVDVGADKCIPCIKMAPILDELKEDYAGHLDVQFVDAWKDRAEAAQYGVRMIPTQIFYASDGTELFRHVGFYSRAEILAKWRELGHPFEPVNDRTTP